MNPSPKPGRFLPISILVAAVMVSGSILWGTTQIVDLAREVRTPPRTAESAAPPAPTVDVAQVSLEGAPFVGDPAAPAIMAYWFDYQCPYCREVEKSVMPRLVSDYVKTGKLRIYFKDYQFLGPDSHTAGLAARAVWDVAPDKFYEWHAAIFAKQDSENSGWGTKDDILALTKSIAGIDAAKVEERMTSEESRYLQAMDADIREGSSMGISGTPGVVIGTTLIAGAQPYRYFKSAVETALASN